MSTSAAKLLKAANTLWFLLPATRRFARSSSYSVLVFRCSDSGNV